MYHQIQSILDEKLQNFIPTKKGLVVLKGFPTSALRHIKIPKLFTLDLNMDLLDLENKSAQMMMDAVQKFASTENVFWCTFEEFIAVSRAALENFFAFKIYYNNLFYLNFPLNYRIRNLEEIFEKYFDNVEDNYNIPEHVELLTKYYGDITRSNNGDYFVSYAQKEDDEDALFDIELLTTNFPITDDSTQHIELSENESDFLDLLNQEQVHDRLVVTWKGDLRQFPHRYLERLSVLKFLRPSLQIYRLEQKVQDTSVEKEHEYLQILKKYWGYPSFRNLKMYKNVDDIENYKEVTLIPQSKIIHDIVSQAEAALNGEDFRDIFVTSPTGAGKSIMFQIPAIYLTEKYKENKPLTIVISPLIGLMNDQVYSLQKKDVKFSATINSEISPVEKMNITTKIQNGEISILYVSPETLLSRSDIKMLIGERKVGLFVIDEAHIVTTWGKSFRSDYWYLGNYIQKLRKEMKFPIATFTATAIYGGEEDMYSETRDSLYMVNPISYFGYVKRDDLTVKINRIKKDPRRENEYLMIKYALLHERLKRAFNKRKKVLIYFPFIRFIREFRDYLQREADESLFNSVSMYYGSMKKEEKNDAFLRFKNGDSLIMLATKAFGMGIDIPDIDIVIHFAPTGNVADYIQEIGRAARDEELQGKAFFDFLEKDFNHVKRLHGISTIRKSQLIQVMDKILSIYSKEKNKRYARNLLISSEDFRYIFDRSKNSDFDSDELDNKLKTALLIIEKDFINKLGFSPIIARPRSIFSIEYLKVKRDVEEDFTKRYHSYVSKIKSLNEDYFGGIYSFDMKRFWEDRYKDMSFPQFKYYFHQKDDRLKMKHIEFVESVFMISLDLLNKKEYTFINEVNAFANKLQTILSKFIRSEDFFLLNDLARAVQATFHLSKYQSESLANQIINSIISLQDAIRKSRTQRINYITVREFGEEAKYKLFPSVDDFIRLIVTHTDKLLKMSIVEPAIQKYELYLTKGNQLEIDKTFIALGLLESIDLLLYEVKGGDNPEIFIRVNSKLQIEKVLHQAENYRNTILDNVYKRHKISVAMLTYLFETEVSSDEFWDYIEDYFLGKIPEVVLERAYAKN